MDSADREIVEDLQIRVKELDNEIRIKEEELAALKAERARCIKEMGDHSDEKYQQNMLELVYEQRMGAKSRKK
ncbi:hypothetical protein [Candidatus Weimeria sp. HCP3S3_B5]|uniref:hypothetical protein n=1 Tax=Candidatus Weimeria sp. HCP3S3_B5 TaxID=3438871 RepID=UPI003073962D|nr:hypothetical protein [Lachnospiraceae bacterium]